MFCRHRIVLRSKLMKSVICLPSYSFQSVNALDIHGHREADRNVGERLEPHHSRGRRSVSQDPPSRSPPPHMEALPPRNRPDIPMPGRSDWDPEPSPVHSERTTRRSPSLDSRARPRDRSPGVSGDTRVLSSDRRERSRDPSYERSYGRTQDHSRERSREAESPQSEPTPETVADPYEGFMSCYPLLIKSLLVRRPEKVRPRS